MHTDVGNIFEIFSLAGPWSLRAIALPLACHRRCYYLHLDVMFKV